MRDAQPQLTYPIAFLQRSPGPLAAWRARERAARLCRRASEAAAPPLAALLALQAYRAFSAHLGLARPAHAWRLLRVAVPATAIAVAIQRLVPMAPPRFAEAGMRDLVYGALDERTWAHLRGFNAYGSFPSVHVLWAALAGAGLYLAGGDRWYRWLGVLWPLAMCATVVETGSHYLLDCLGSLALLAGCAALEGACCRAGRRGRRARDTETPERLSAAA